MTLFDFIQNTADICKTIKVTTEFDSPRSIIVRAEFSLPGDDLLYEISRGLILEHKHRLDDLLASMFPLIAEAAKSKGGAK